jgi:hypothetical protein
VLSSPGTVGAEPTAEQVAAIKANCRSDYMSYCWSVPRGGPEAAQCLKQNLANYCADVDYGEGRQLHCLLSNKASLSPGCQGALAKLTH